MNVPTLATWLYGPMGMGAWAGVLVITVGVGKLPRNFLSGSEREGHCTSMPSQDYFEATRGMERIGYPSESSSVAVRADLNWARSVASRLRRSASDRQHATGLSSGTLHPSLSRNRLNDSHGCRYCIPPLPPASKRLAGGTMPFIRRYSTSCP
jgi:hypothetical protein